MAIDTAEVLSGQRARVTPGRAPHPATRRVLVTGVDRPGGPGLMGAATAELLRSRHQVELAIAPEPAGRGKFENLNAQLAARAWRESIGWW